MWRMLHNARTPFLPGSDRAKHTNIAHGEVPGSSVFCRRRRSIWTEVRRPQDGENRACGLLVGYSTTSKTPVQRGFLRLTRISPSVANVDNSARNGFSRVSYISRVSNTSTMTAGRGFDKGWSSSVGSLHLDLGVLPDETHISTKRAPTQ